MCENEIKLAQQKHQLELDKISEENRKQLFDAEVEEIRAMKSSDEKLDCELGDPTIMKKYKYSKRVTEWVDSSLANNNLCATLRSNRAENEMQENGFLPALNLLPIQEMDNHIMGLRCYRIQTPNQIR